MPSMPAPGEWTYVIPVEGSEVDVDVVRFWVQDTDPNLRLLGDLEIQYLVDKWMPKVPSLVYVAHKAAEVIAAKFAGVVSVSADGVSVNVADLADRYVALSRRLLQTHKDHEIGGEIDIRNLMWGSTRDYGIAPLVFGMGLHDNREAGRQNYGGPDYGAVGYNNELAPGGY